MGPSGVTVRRRAWALAGILVVSVLAACEPRSQDAGLVLSSFRQAERSGVGLNETLVFHFSAELDPTSITPESLSIVGPDSERARGQFQVHKDRLEFHPELPLQRDLMDGGFVPGASYRVEVQGFPRPDGVRSLTGAVLARTVRTWFRTVAADDRSSPFLDPGTGRVQEYLRPIDHELAPLEPIRLRFPEALDPRSVLPARFQLRGYPEAGATEEFEEIPLRLRLVVNRRDGAELELRPGDPAIQAPAFRALDPGRYFLWMKQEDEPLRTLGNRPLPSWNRPLEFTVRVSSQRVELETFDTRHRRSPELPEDSDGTAYWGDGVVRVRFPLAAGTGLDGPTVLEGVEDRVDIQATRLRVDPGTSCELRGSGTVILRAQRSLEIYGSLRRQAERSELARGAGESHTEWRRRTLEAEGWVVPPMSTDFRLDGATVEATRTLTDWLGSVVERGHAWTILIAGGDVRIHGTLEVDGPVLIVAGGWVRVPGRVESREAWRSHDGGGGFLPAAELAPLLIDEPQNNPLIEPLRLAVLSDRIRPPRGVARWRSGRARGEAGQGRFTLRFLGERDVDSVRGAALVTEVFGPVDDVALLEGCEAVRMRIELVVPAGSADLPWMPPRVDEVELRWDEELR